MSEKIDESDHLRLCLAIEAERRAVAELRAATTDKRLLLVDLSRAYGLSEKDNIDPSTGEIARG